MQVSLQNAGKRFNRDWIFRHVNLAFLPGKSYAITGPNGSGKSTLLQLIAGSLQATEGSVSYTLEDGSLLPEGRAFERVSLAAPYLELIEEMTAGEMVQFHIRFKSCPGNPEMILRAVGLSQAADKQIRYFSSGMKQRLKLALAFYSETDLLLLDEPLTNLDASGAETYSRLIENNKKGRTIIISSNDSREHSFCTELIDITKLK